jgi:hypothetical protein
MQELRGRTSAGYAYRQATSSAQSGRRRAGYGDCICSLDFCRVFVSEEKKIYLQCMNSKTTCMYTKNIKKSIVSFTYFLKQQSS